MAGRPRRILDVGSGSGFLTHIFATLAGENSFVAGVEHVAELRDISESNMRKSPEGSALLDSGRVRFYIGDGRKGWPQKRYLRGELESEYTGWDAIHVGAGAIELHDELVKQLRSPGRMFIPIAEDGRKWFSEQYLWTVDKDKAGNITKTKHCKAKFVWLMDSPN